MGRPANPANPPCARCGCVATVGKGHMHGQPRWSCGGCGRSFGPTTGTALYRLKTPAAEVARTLLVVLRRGSLLAAEDVTGHKYETVGRWLRQAGAHAKALTEALVHDLRLDAVEVDEFWSFVQKKGGLPNRPPTTRQAWDRAGAA